MAIGPPAPHLLPSPSPFSLEVTARSGRLFAAAPFPCPPSVRAGSIVSEADGDSCADGDSGGREFGIQFRSTDKSMLGCKVIIDYRYQAILIYKLGFR